MWPSGLYEVSLAPWLVAVSVSLVAAGIDVKQRRIPNWLTFPTFVGGIVWSTSTGGLTGAGNALLGCAAAALPYCLLFLFANGGAGDAKLMGALGAWLGLLGAAATLVCVAVCGAVLAILFAMAAGRLGTAIRNLSQMSWSAFGIMRGQPMRSAQRSLPPLAGMQTMPYGLAISFGVCAAAVSRHWIGI